MVAYSFQRQFAEPILDGTKGGTVRAPRKRGHCEPGEELQLYVGMRTPSCSLIARKPCLEIERITLHFAGNEVIFPSRDAHLRGWALDAFARFDGFHDWLALRDFWRETNQHPHRFDGYHIRWMPLPEALQ